MKNLPGKSSFSLFKGTYLVHNDEDVCIVIFFSNMGKVKVFHNNDLKAETRSFKLRIELNYEMLGNFYSIDISPENSVLTKFDCLIKKNEDIVKIFSYSYNFDWKRKLVLFGGLFVMAVILVSLSAPDWSFWSCTIIYVLIFILVFRNRLLIVKESGNPVNVDFLP